MKSIEQVYQALLLQEQRKNTGVSAQEISLAIKMDRANVSRYLNVLFQENRVEKLEGRPVLYKIIRTESASSAAVEEENSLDKLGAIQTSLQIPIQQAKAAILYPPKGLHTLLLGETGVGKSMFAELMYQFAKESGVIKKDAPFVRFNCADYAENSQLLVSQIFGVKKGAYTGADRDRDGLIKRADGGFLFLDEVHRLSPQGQEMLFTFIDKGRFYPLGETERSVSAEVRIVAATTEEPKSYLLNTFTRRIPMIIELPSLKSKDLSERYHLIELFIRQESNRIGKSIYAEKNAIIAFLLYDCPNNIGQLKSDIQLSCAKAFVNFKSKRENYILITSTDLPLHVRKGLMLIQAHRDNIDFLLKSKSPTIKFSLKEEKAFEGPSQVSVNEDFYDLIEQKLEALKNSGLREEEISYAIQTDLEAHFNKYIGDIPAELQRKDITKLVSGEILMAVGDIIKLAEQRLQRSFGENIFIGLALHLHGFIERMKRGVRIYHPKLNTIRVDYPEEFLTAMEAARIVDNAFGINTPLDEIGYLSMFLSPKSLELHNEEKSLVGVLVLMHGNSTASSMAALCNEMIGIVHAEAIDMPLSMGPELMYEQTKAKVAELDKGRGVLLMVDMGSLTSFGQMLKEEMGVLVKTIDMVSTAHVIDACRKALLGRDIHYIYDSIKGLAGQHAKTAAEISADKPKAIITACFTGEGASERLKRIIEESIQDDTIDIIPLNIMSKKSFLGKVEQYREKYSILAIASTLDIQIEGVLSISASDILAGDGIAVIRQLIEIEQNYDKIAISLNGHIQVDGERLVKSLRNAISSMEKGLQLRVSEEVKIGMLLHMSFLVDKLMAGGKENFFEDLQGFRLQHQRELAIVRSHMEQIEQEYGLKIGEHENAYICKMLLENMEENDIV